LFHQLDISSAGCLVVSSTGCFMNWLLHEQAASSTGYFINWLFHQLAVSSTGWFLNWLIP
jgi:hypothetical protein